ncbi:MULTISPECIES: sodium:solute symporter [Mesonia]|uniref:Sodium/glucose cotransporter n=1 Tax=Mesonia oceanica TaxID=2687242 RepID=A0AC61Y712_9FLAO|nr:MULTISPECIES: sodium:solute symporter [Mesonia]MAN26751.1 sodium:solute symporter [Mesonia sp.]MAQ40455.1 sodium:solute symporter [Mesonia sp.]MBJ98076.1 sodium:solute symporter [Flavobacteriaceae bacterium]VVV00292.1 Sodium/glucose cotransporter [Mesonia oceanica]|tara:strand:+ start:29708 stop:31393 length:1686 start_codon:yes stop_codon:yes gene_type:complete
MHTLDIIVLVATLAFIVIFGYYKTRGSKNVNDFLKGGNEARWWTVGLSVMATQASAITFLSAPGQAFHSGMGFVQFYLGVPIAMVVICMVFIPIYHRLKVYTAYEYLETRFDLKTRTLTAFLFLIQRSLAAGITIFAPSIILSAVLGWDLLTLNILIGSLVVIYTVSGGTKAVSVTQKQQMGVIFLGLIIAFTLIVSDLPQNITFSNALEIAAANEKLNVLDFSFDWKNRYTFWSGLIGGTFLALSYFGTDQSQVQRYLSARSLKQSQMGLIFNGFLKVPMQFFILLIGVMVFVFYQFNASPLNFNPAAEEEVLKSEYSYEYQQLQQELESNRKEKALLSYELVNTQEKAPIQQQIQNFNKKEKKLREQGAKLIKKTNKELETNDKDYVFIHFILHNLPKGLIGLLLAVILSAAMSSTASELNSLASTTTMDLYKRNVSSEKNDKHFLNASRLFTLMWGIFAVIIACTADLFDNLIQLVNIIGSIFYGNVLGIFLLAFFVKFVKSNSTFIAAIITQIIVIIGWWFDWMPYLWLNMFGCALVMSIAILIEFSVNQKLETSRE